MSSAAGGSSRERMGNESGKAVESRGSSDTKSTCQVAGARTGQQSELATRRTVTERRHARRPRYSSSSRKSSPCARRRDDDGSTMRPLLRAACGCRRNMGATFRRPGPEPQRVESPRTRAKFGSSVVRPPRSTMLVSHRRPAPPADGVSPRRAPTRKRAGIIGRCGGPRPARMTSRVRRGERQRVRVQALPSVISCVSLTEGGRTFRHVLAS